jgi:YHS domain-containing protein
MLRNLPHLLTALSVIVCSNLIWATDLNVNSAGVALSGYDPVSYFLAEAPQKGPLKGDSKFQAKHEEVTYFFSSEANKQEFLKNPTKYVPAFGGWCAYAVADSKEKVEVDAKSFLIQEGRLLLFFKGFFADTRDKWLNTKAKSPAKFLSDADANWPEVKNKKP